MVPGLGLYICRELVHRMNGRIWVESTIGHGSVFTFEIPLQAIAHLAPGAPTTARRQQREQLQQSSALRPVQGGLTKPLRSSDEPSSVIEQEQPVPHSHEQPHANPGPSIWRSAIRATVHCLTGCAIGEVLGMIIATALGWGNAASIAVSVALAFLFGYSLTVRPIRAAGITLRRAVRIAFASDTVSITSMEIIDNAFILIVPGAIAAGLTDALFWSSLALSLVIAFVLSVPVNRWLIARGRGHAVMHGLSAH